MGGGHGVNGRSRKQDTDGMGTWRRAGREHWQARMGTPSVGRQVKTSPAHASAGPSAMTNGSTGQEIWKMSVPAGWVCFKAGKPALPSKTGAFRPFVSHTEGWLLRAQNHSHVTKTCDQLLQLNKNQ